MYRGTTCICLSGTLAAGDVSMEISVDGVPGSWLPLLSRCSLDGWESEFCRFNLSMMSLDSLSGVVSGCMK